MTLTGLPEWTPTAAITSLFVEGGTYTFDGGAWTLALDTVPSSGTGHSITYQEMNRSIRDMDMDRSVTYADLPLTQVSSIPSAGLIGSA